MKETLAIIRMNMMGKTKDALRDAGVVSMNVVACLGRGKGCLCGAGCREPGGPPAPGPNSDGHCHQPWDHIFCTGHAADHQ